MWANRDVDRQGWPRGMSSRRIESAPQGNNPSMSQSSDSLPRIVRPVPMATDGQGVILAVPHSVDARQRTAMDLLSRRVAHRLGCPVATGQVQRNTLHIDAPLAHLHAKGAREIVVAPMTFALLPFTVSLPRNLAAGSARYPGVSIRTADPIGGVVEVIEATIEVLGHSERTPDPNTRLIMLVPFAEREVVAHLCENTDVVSAAGWRDGHVAPMSANHGDVNLNGALDVGADGRVLLVPLTVTPGPFSSRVADVAEVLGVEAAVVSLHSSEVLTKLISRRVIAARRS